MKKSPRPPRFASFILAYLIDIDIRYGAMGDLEEQFRHMCCEKGPFKARLNFWLQVLAALPAFIKNSILWSFVMIHNYLKVFMRNLKKHRGYSLINFTGLTIGISIFILIFLFVQFELGFDKSHENLHRIYRVQGANGSQPSMAPAVANWISRQIPEVEKIVRFKFRHDYLAKYKPQTSSNKEKSLVIRDFGWADASVFEIFTFPFVVGDPKTAFEDPFSLVLTESLAYRIFRDEYPIGKTILINNSHEYRITGIIQDLRQSHLRFEALASFQTLGKTIGQKELDSFDSWNLSTFVLLAENHDTKVISGKITELFKDKIQELRKTTLNFALMQLKDVYFFPGGSGNNGNLQLVYVFIAIAVFILLIACVNFVNLSTARASLRAKEVGIKKVVGSSRNRLILQFLSESILFSVFAMVAAFGVAWLFLPEFKRLIMRDLSMDYFANPLIILVFFAGAILLGVFSGFYPSFYLSAFKPASVLKGDKIKGAKSGIFRKVLISSQFAISIVLIVGTFTVFKQMQYVKNKDLGFHKEHIVNMEVDRNLGIRNRKAEFKERLLQHPQIMNVTFSQGRPGVVYNWEGFELEGERNGYAIFTVDPDYFDVYGLEIIAGRGFSWDISTDQFQTCLINESAVRNLGLEEPVGTVFHHDDIEGSSFPVKDVEVIGVVKDFHYQNFHFDIQPQMFGWNEGWLWMISAKIAATDVPATITHIRNVWKEFSPEFPFEYHFIDALFESQYQNEERLGQIIGYSSILGIFIACLGLFGLASFMAEQRTKEIGIRKILGASILSLVLMLSKEFSKWVIVANIIAWPVAYFAMNKWLQSFAFRTNIGFGIFALSAILALVIAVITVSYQSLRAAYANPIDSLRYE